MIGVLICGLGICNMGRKKISIDWELVDNMLSYHCTGTEVAAIIGMHPNTLYRVCEEVHNISFSDYSTQKKANGKQLLRQKQFDVAMSGDKTMLVWLGKQYLGQADKMEQTATVTNVEVFKIAGQEIEFASNN